MCLFSGKVHERYVFVKQARAASESVSPSTPPSTHAHIGAHYTRTAIEKAVHSRTAPSTPSSLVIRRCMAQETLGLRHDSAHGLIRSGGGGRRGPRATYSRDLPEVRRDYRRHDDTREQFSISFAFYFTPFFCAAVHRSLYKDVSYVPIISPLALSAVYHLTDTEPTVTADRAIVTATLSRTSLVGGCEVRRFRESFSFFPSRQSRVSRFTTRDARRCALPTARANQTARKKARRRRLGEELSRKRCTDPVSRQSCRAVRPV